TDRHELCLHDARPISHQLVNGVGLVVHPEAVNDGGTGLIQANHFHIRTLTAELDHRLVQRANGGNVPEVRAAEVYHNIVHRFLEDRKSTRLNSSHVKI